MVKVILSAEEFLQILKPGDKFWHMTSAFDAPTTIEGPCTIQRIVVEKNGSRVYYSYKSSKGLKESRKFASDFTNQWHGVFLNQQDAEAYFKERKHAYATDPKLIKQVAKNKLLAVRDYDPIWDYDPYDDCGGDYDKLIY